MRKFLKYTLATFVGVIAGFIVILLITIGLIGSLAALGEKEVVVKEKSTLVVDLDQTLQDRASENPFEDFGPFNLNPSKKVGLNQILSSLKKAAKDNRIKGIYLKSSIAPIGMAHAQEIRKALLEFKESGKFIIAHGNYFTQKGYYLASASDKVYLTPTGSLDFKGLATYVQFIKGTLEKIGIKPEIIRHGKFKAAVEPLILEKMSDANREQNLTFITSIWKEITKEISQSRNISVEELEQIANNLSIRDDKTALEYKFVDQLKFKNEVIDELKELCNIKKGKKIRTISVADYYKAPFKDPEVKGLAKDKIAVIYAQGTVIDGEGDIYSIGYENIPEAIRTAAEDSTIKAIVLRVNSGGGSALTSEIIWNEVNKAKAVKPVIASMGNYAASGGYYILCNTDHIIAEPTTLTGSIGVFGVIMTGEKLLKKTLGLSFDHVKTNDHADFGGAAMPFPLFGAIASRDLTQQEKDIIQTGVEQVYDVFISHVAEGRKMTKEAVDAIGQGRIWSGTSALELGLVDELGGLRRAIEVAKEKAGVDNFRIVEYPKQKDAMEEFIKSFSSNAQAKLLEVQLGSQYPMFKTLEQAKEYSGIQARMPYIMEIY